MNIHFLAFVIYINLAQGKAFYCRFSFIFSDRNADPAAHISLDQSSTFYFPLTLPFFFFAVGTENSFSFGMFSLEVCG